MGDSPLGQGNSQISQRYRTLRALGLLNNRSPGVPLSLHPGLYAFTRSAGGGTNVWTKLSPDDARL